MENLFSQVEYEKIEEDMLRVKNSISINYIRFSNRMQYFCQVSSMITL